jgi:hypothetical protein
MRKFRTLVLGYDSHTHFALSEVFDLVHIVADTDNATEKWSDIYSFKMNVNVPTLEALNDGSYQYVINKYQRYADINSRRYVTVNARESEIFNGFMMYFYWAHNLLRKQKIDLVLFHNLPHESFDYILYLIARYYGLRTIITHQSFVVTGRFWICEEIERFGDMATLPDIAAKVSSNYILPEHWYYMNDVSNKWNYTWKDLVYEVMIHPWRMPAAALRYHYSRQYQKSRISTVTEFDKTKNFVYVPLHLQPELTTSSIGGADGRYGDQLQMIEQLSLLIPTNVVIYLKENPKQTAHQRDQLFYRRIARLLNVKFLPPETPSSFLIQHSIAVATVTGTAGWEALFCGKPCLVFGNAWYSSFPGVTKFNSNMRFESWLSSTPPSREDLVEWLENLLRKAGEGVVDPQHTVVVPNFSPDLNARNIAASLKKYIEFTSSSEEC